MPNDLLKNIRMLLAFLATDMPHFIEAAKLTTGKKPRASRIAKAENAHRLAFQLLAGSGKDLGIGEIAETAADEALSIVSSCSSEDDLDSASSACRFSKDLHGVIAQRIVLVAYLRHIGRL